MPRILRPILVFALVIGAFFAGYKLRPRLNAEVFHAAYAKYVGGHPSHKQDPQDGVVPTVMTTDFRRKIGIAEPRDAQARRLAMAGYVFRGETAGMARLPDGIERDVVFPPLMDLQLAGIDVYTVRMPFDVTSEVFHLIPRQRRNCLMIYQEGHMVSFLQRKRFLKRLTAEGCDVLALSLPLTGGINSRPEIDHPRFGRMLLNDPADLELLDAAEYSSLAYFLTPLVAALNQAAREHDFTRIGATGFSGGGWAVEVLAALDPRIQATYAVAGSMPMVVHAALPNWGSPEQRQGRFYEIATYPELYVMAADRPGRRHLQFYNESDPCCFSGRMWAAWKDPVAERATRLGGHFRIFTYSDSNHTLSKSVALTIIDDFLHGGTMRPAEVIAH